MATTPNEHIKICPMVGSECLRESCEWWMTLTGEMRWDPEKMPMTYTYNQCAVVQSAIGRVFEKMR